MNIKRIFNIYAKIITVKSLYVFSFTITLLIGCSENPLGTTDVGADFISKAPVLTAINDFNFPSRKVLINTALTPIDINNINTNSDASMNYQCFYDHVVDGSASGNDCSTLPGTPSFNTTSGILNWTPDSTAYGAYEIRVVGTHINGKTGEEIFVIDVQQAYTTNNLILNLDGQFADLTGQGSNSPFTTIWKNLVSGGSSLDGSLANFGETITSGWTGNGASQPYSLTFDGVDDYTDHGTGINGNINFLFSTWVSPASVASPNTVIASNYESSTLGGFELRQAFDGSGKIDLWVNFSNYSNAILSDSPVAYYKLDETGGTAAIDYGSGGNNGTYSNATLNNSLTPITSEIDTSVTFNGTSSEVSLGNPAALQITGNQTIEMWLRPTTFSGRRNPYAKAYGGEGTITQETNRTLSYYYGISGANASSYQGFNSSGTLTLNTWNHVVLVRNLTTSRLYWYINGAQTNSVPANYAAAVSGALPAYIGRGYVSRYSGQITHVAIYDKALSAAEVLTHYNAASTTYCRSTTVLTDGAWAHLAASYDGTDHKLFVNGVQECTLNRAHTASTQSLTLGSRGSSLNWQGQIGSFRFYTTGGATEVTDNYNNTQNQY